MSVKERDPLTGHQTTGHEWDGITELNTRVPTAVWFFIAVTAIWSAIAWVLLPTWPLLTTYTRGILGADQRAEVEKSVIDANNARADWATRIDDMPAYQIMADPALMQRVTETGNQLFGDNCAGCHGVNAQGGPGFPSLIDSAWLWGGTFDDIMETIRVGINNDNPDTRVSQMLAFGRDGMLTRDQIRTVTDYVQNFSGTPAPAEKLTEGATIFAENCASCHGDNGTGDISQGAPDLTDHFWIYGGSDKAIFQTVYGGRQGWMPDWENRLTPTERKILAVYIMDKGKEANASGAQAESAEAAGAQTEATPVEAAQAEGAQAEDAQAEGVEAEAAQAEATPAEGTEAEATPAEGTQAGGTQ
ncbi:cytochrome-c oxidase, cbb3-type subunit III [Paracoccus pacificus]|uniref:Cytochrome c oxidase subunit III n=1 Tax=Paracoccus pacificus TaxID=1463598 RepID=A0ABW4R9F1_9RHOB